MTKAAAKSTTKKAAAKSTKKAKSVTRKHVTQKLGRVTIPAPDPFEPEIVDAPPSRSEVVDAFIALQSQRLQIAMRRWLKRGATFATIGDDDLRSMFKDCGRAATLVLLDVDSPTLDTKLGKIGPRAAQQPVARVSPARKRFDVELERSRERMAQQPAQSVRVSDAILSAAGRALVSYDATEKARAVRLDSLSEGASVKTLDCPDERLHGVSATLVRVGVGSCSVRLGRVHRSVTTRDDENNEKTVEFDAPGRLVTWARSTMVVPQ